MTAKMTHAIRMVSSMGSGFAMRPQRTRARAGSWSVNRPLIAGGCQSEFRSHRRGHGPFRGRMPHDHVRVGRLNVCNEVRSRRQPIQRGHHKHRPGGTSRVPETGPRLGSSADLSVRRPTQSWCRQPRGSGAEPRSCELPPLLSFSYLSALTDEGPHAFKEDHFFVACMSRRQASGHPNLGATLSLKLRCFAYLTNSWRGILVRGSCPVSVTTNG